MTLPIGYICIALLLIALMLGLNLVTITKLHKRLIILENLKILKDFLKYETKK